jgi:hypothetical protein
MAQLTEVSIKEAIDTLTPNQQYILAKQLERLKALSHPDEIRSSLIETRKDFGIDLLPWNSQLTRESKINEALQILDVSPRAMIIRCRTNYEPRVPTIKPLKLQSIEDIAKAKEMRLARKNQKVETKKLELETKQRLERHNKYLGMLGGSEKIFETMLGVKKIHAAFFELRSLCVDEQYNINNTTTMEITIKNPETCNKIYSSVYDHLFYVNGKPGISNLTNLFGRNSNNISELDARFLISELPDLITKIIIAFTLYEVSQT